MLQLSKKTEYGLIALGHMARQAPGKVFTAKEIAAVHHISYDLLAKVLQKLVRADVIKSVQGMRGGYYLARSPGEVTIGSIIRSIENEKPMIAECYHEGKGNCSIFENCSLRQPLGKVQKNLNDVFENTTIAEMV
jgi:Rrf2 family protein